MMKRFNESRKGAVKTSTNAEHLFPASIPGGRTILLITRDKWLHESLRSLANAIGLIVIRAERSTGVVAVLQATKPVVVMLDLDLPDRSAWEAADILLNDPDCPTVILLTGRTTQFDVRTAIRAGALVSKHESPQRLLERIEEALAVPESDQAEKNSTQRVLIRWLRPSGWVPPTIPAFRTWGIRE